MGSVRKALFDCNWTAAPLKIKRLILLYQLLMINDSFIDCAPFATLNMELLSEVSIFGNIFK